MVDPVPRQLGDVQQAVHAAEIDKRAEVGQALDRAHQHLALSDLVPDLLGLSVPLLVQVLALRQDHLAVLAVDLDHLAGDVLAHIRVEIADELRADVRCR